MPPIPAPLATPAAQPYGAEYQPTRRERRIAEWTDKLDRMILDGVGDDVYVVSKGAARVH
jgi:hypothetical protein